MNRRVTAGLLMAVILTARSGSGADEIALSRLGLRGMSAEWGRPMADKSVDGNPLRIGGKSYASGVGTHAASRVRVRLNGATRFQAWVGVDDETGGKGSVIFRIDADQTHTWSSGVIRGGEAARRFDLDVTPYKELVLEVTDGGDGISHDHANWAEAKFFYSGQPPEVLYTPKPGDLPVIEARVPTAPLELFNGVDLDNWIADLPRGGRKEDVWQVRDGTLFCAGKPAGHLISDSAWRDYRLEVEWRWPPQSKGGNNGVLVHTTELHVLGNLFPRSIEVQLMSGNAGDFWVIGEDITVPDMAARRKGRHIRNLTDGSEKPIGEWNHMVIHARGDTLKVWVNGDLVNEGFECSVSAGRITLQSEGAPCQFRRVTVMPLPAE